MLGCPVSVLVTNSVNAISAQDCTEHSALSTICDYPALMAGTEVIKSNSSGKYLPLSYTERVFCFYLQKFTLAYSRLFF